MDTPKAKTRLQTSLMLEPGVRELVEAYRLRTGRTFSGAINWLVKRQLALIEKDPGQDIAS